jgi:ribosome-binding protein aMBF1 (putative translation factor)
MDTFSNKKICRKCGTSKYHKEFHKDGNSKDGRRSVCKDCTNKKSRDIYHVKNKKDESLTIEMEFNQSISDVHKKTLVCKDPDEILEIAEEYVEVIKKYRQKLLEKGLTSKISIKNAGQNEIFIQGKIQEHFLNSKKVLVLPDDLVIKISTTVIDIQLPETIKLNSEEVLEVVKILTLH